MMKRSFVSALALSAALSAQAQEGPTGFAISLNGDAIVGDPVVRDVARKTDVALANADVQYLSTHYSSRFGQLLVVRGKYLTAPDTRNGESPATVRQVRLYNLCTYNFWNGSAINCLLENQLRRDTQGYYTLVIAAVWQASGFVILQAATPLLERRQTKFDAGCEQS